MSQFSTTRPRRLGDGAPSGSTWLGTWKTRLGTWRLQRQTSRALLALSDAGLKDIGLHRSEASSTLSGLRSRLRPMPGSV
jgi:uncharacterized protein YjiS (DUF1127 family)